MDQETARLIIELQLEEIRQLKDEKSSECDENDDFLLALRLYEENANDALATVEDHLAAQRLGEEDADVRQDDEHPLQQKPQGIPQHQLAALSLEERIITPETDLDARTTEESIEENVVDEPLGHDAPIVSNQMADNDSDIYVDPTPRECVACMGEHDISDTIALACTPEPHVYCRDCIVKLFHDSLTDDTLFPPRCCRIPIPVEDVERFVSEGTVERYHDRVVELETPNPVYCAAPEHCSRFIAPEAIKDNIATCKHCKFDTCTVCRKGAHEGSCQADTAVEQLLETAKEQGWQRCYKCRTLVELTRGCYHITCRCSAEFCYLCGAKWKECLCPQLDARHLLDNANEIVDRQPRTAGVPRAVAVQRALERLRQTHDCNHDDMVFRHRSRATSMTCDGCHDRLPVFIFECDTCDNYHLCRRCRNNRRR